MRMSKLYQWRMDSPIGRLHLVASDKGLKGIFFDAQPVPVAKSLGEPEAAVRVLACAVNELTQYFDGKRREFSVPLDADGTGFQKRVWDELLRIPYGETRSYGDIARRISNAKAVRAVGSANGKNPLCVIIPCHRVIASDGSIGGYSGGLGIKTKLLELERSTARF